MSLVNHKVKDSLDQLFEQTRKEKVKQECLKRLEKVEKEIGQFQNLSRIEELKPEVSRNKSNTLKKKSKEERTDFKEDEICARIS